MDKTYAETQNEAPFDWNKALANPPDYGSPDYDNLYILSGDWTTCACGNECAIIPRYKQDSLRFAKGQPKDEALADLGHRFHNQITMAEWEDAKETLQAIEARSAILIQQELAKRNSK